MRISDWSSDVCSSDLLNLSDLVGNQCVFFRIATILWETPEGRVVWSFPQIVSASFADIERQITNDAKKIGLELRRVTDVFGDDFENRLLNYLFGIAA